MSMRLSEIGHSLGYCPKKRKSQIAPDQYARGIATTGEVTMDAKKDAIGKFLPITFVKRMVMYIVTLLVVMNFGVFYFTDKIPLSTVLIVTIFEIVYMILFVSFWVPRYQREGAQVRW